MEGERAERATEGQASSSLNMNRQFYVKPRLCSLVKLSALIKQLAVTKDSSSPSSGPALWTALPPAALTSTRGSLLWLGGAGPAGPAVVPPPLLCLIRLGSAVSDVAVSCRQTGLRLRRWAGKRSRRSCRSSRCLPEEKEFII